MFDEPEISCFCGDSPGGIALPGEHTSVNFNQMRIDIVNNKGQLIVCFELKSNPFKVGGLITIQATYCDKSFWPPEEVSGRFIVEKIEYFSAKSYTKNKQIAMVFTASVQVRAE